MVLYNMFCLSELTCDDNVAKHTVHLKCNLLPNFKSLETLLDPMKWTFF